MVHPAYRQGVLAALKKLGGTHVPVYEEETPQTENYPMGTATEEDKDTSTIWSSHDNRKDVATSSGYNS